MHQVYVLLKEYLRKDDDGDEDDDSDDDDSEDDEEDDSGDDSGDDSDPDFNAKHPRWPAGSPNGIGGEFAPKDNAAAATTAGTAVAGNNSPTTDDVRNSPDSTVTQITSYTPTAYTTPEAALSNTSSLPLETNDNVVRDNHSENDIVNYPDGASVIDPNTGKPYPMPNGMDIAANVKAAEDYDSDATDADKASSMIYWFSQGAPQDYQRPDGYIPALFGDYVGSFRNVTNYNYGAVSAAMGYSLDETLTAAGFYNQVRGNSNLPGMNTTYGIQNSAVTNITQGFQDYLDGKWTTQTK